VEWWNLEHGGLVEAAAAAAALILASGRSDSASLMPTALGTADEPPEVEDDELAGVEGAHEVAGTAVDDTLAPVPATEAVEEFWAAVDFSSYFSTKLLTFPC